jgi:hypothetical protein
MCPAQRTDPAGASRYFGTLLVLLCPSPGRQPYPSVLLDRPAAGAPKAGRAHTPALLVRSLLYSTRNPGPGASRWRPLRLYAAMRTLSIQTARLEQRRTGRRRRRIAQISDRQVTSFQCSSHIMRLRRHTQEANSGAFADPFHCFWVPLRGSRTYYNNVKKWSTLWIRSIARWIHLRMPSSGTAWSAPTIYWHASRRSRRPRINPTQTTQLDPCSDNVLMILDGVSEVR